MAWVRLDEGFARHPKIAEVGPLGLAMQVAGLCYCNQHLTDGFIPYAIAATLLDLSGLGTDPRLIIDDLVQVGVWREASGGFVIHDYLEYQPSKAAVVDERKKKQAAGRKGGQASAQARGQASAQPPGQAESKQTRSTTPTIGQAESKPDTDTDTDTDSKVKPVSAVAEATVSDEARHLTGVFAEAVQRNGHRVPQQGSAAESSWLVEMDRLLRIDRTPPKVVEHVIRWCADDEFERANVLSVPKLRKRFPQLRLKAERTKAATNGHRARGGEPDEYGISKAVL